MDSVVGYHVNHEADPKLAEFLAKRDKLARPTKKGRTVLDAGGREVNRAKDWEDYAYKVRWEHPVLRLFDDEELSFNPGHQYPIQIRVSNPDFGIDPLTVLVDRRLCGWSSLIARVTVVTFVELPPGEQRKLTRYEYRDAKAFAQWDSARGGRYKLTVDCPQGENIILAMRYITLLVAQFMQGTAEEIPD